MSPHHATSGAAGSETPADQIRQRRVLLSRDRGAHLRWLVHTDDAMHAHHSPDPLVVHHPTPTREFLGHARLAIGAVGRGVDLPHQPDQLGLGELRGGWPGRGACPPIVERLTGHVCDVTRHRDREPLGLPGSDPPIAGHCPDSFTQKAVARLSRSRSIRSRAFSLRSSANSVRSDVVTPARSPRSTRAWRTQFPNVPSPTPRPRATSTTVRPSSITNATASRLNSSVNERRVLTGSCSITDMVTSYWR